MAAWTTLCTGATIAAEARADDASVRGLFLHEAAPPCALCHSLRAAGAQGAIGPDLDALRPDAERVAQALRLGIGAMPSYRDSLSERQREALAEYVARVAGAADR